MAPLHIFDLDGTLVRKNSSFAFFKFLLKKEKLPLSYFFWAICWFLLFRSGRLSLKELHKRVFARVFRGRKKAFFIAEVDPFLDSWLEKQLDSGVLEKAQGEKVLFSSSPDFLVEKIAGRLRIETWIASEYSVDKEGLFCEISRVVDGEEKLRSAQEIANGRGVHAYSDSEDDAPLLYWADQAILVRPSRKLRKMAFKWKKKSFKL